MKRLKAPFTKFNPKLPKRQRARLAEVFTALKPTLRFFTFMTNPKGQVALHARSRNWGTYTARQLIIGKRGGLIYRRRYTKLKIWLER